MGRLTTRKRLPSFFNIDLLKYNNMANKIDHVSKFYEIRDIFERAPADAKPDIDAVPDSDDDIDGTPVFDPLHQVLAYLGGAPQQRADRFEYHVLQQIDPYSALSANACDAVKHSALASIKHFNEMPFEAGTFATVVCGDIMYGLHILLTFLVGGSDSDKYRNVDDLAKFRKAMSKTVLVKIKNIVEKSPSLSDAMADHLLHHEKNKLALPRIAESEEFLKQSIPDIDAKAPNSIIGDLVLLRVDAGAGLLIDLEKNIQVKLTLLCEYSTAQINNEKPASEDLITD